MENKCKYVCVSIDRCNIDFEQLYSKQRSVDTTVNRSALQLISTSASVCILHFSPSKFLLPDLLEWLFLFTVSVLFSLFQTKFIRYSQNDQCIPKGCFNNFFK